MIYTLGRGWIVKYLLQIGEQKWLEMINLRQMKFKDVVIFLLSGPMGIGAVSPSWLTVALNKVCMSVLHFWLKLWVSNLEKLTSELQDLLTAVREPSFSSALELLGPFICAQIKYFRSQLMMDSSGECLIFFHSNPHGFLSIPISCRH